MLDKAERAQNSLAALDKEMLDPIKMVEYELMNMILNTYKKIFTGIHYANERHYDASYLLAERVLEEVEWNLEYALRN